jgi:hypothetical protein
VLGTARPIIRSGRGLMPGSAASGQIQTSSGPEAHPGRDGTGAAHRSSRSRQLSRPHTQADHPRNPNGLYLLKGGGPDVRQTFRVPIPWRKRQGLIVGKRYGTTEIQSHPPAKAHRCRMTWCARSNRHCPNKPAPILAGRATLPPKSVTSSTAC